MTDARRSDRQQTSDEWTAMVASKAARREPVSADEFTRNLREIREVGTAADTQFAQCLAAYRALADQLAASEARAKYLADFVYAEEGVFTYPDGETISCRRGSTYEQLKQRLAEYNESDTLP